MAHVRPSSIQKEFWFAIIQEIFHFLEILSNIVRNFLQSLRRGFSQKIDFSIALFCDSRSLKEKEKKLSRVHILHIFLHCNFTSSIAIEDNRQFYTHTLHTYIHSHDITALAIGSHSQTADQFEVLLLSSVCCE